MLAPSHPFGGRHRGWHALVEAGFAAARIDAVLAFYDEPHRVYHDRRHLHEMLDTAGALGLSLSATQALALLFHDAVYVPGAPRGANEAMSAQLMRAYAAGLDESIRRDAGAIVLDTAEHRARSEAAALVLDLDLLRLAGPREKFDLHAHELFLEQRPLLAAADDEAAWTAFAARRLPFLEWLLQQPSIYALPLFVERFEAAARANLRAAIESVSRSGSRGTA